MNKLVKLVILSSLFGTSITSSAQDHVSNIRVQQSDEQLIVMYDLSERADIEAYVSFDGGATYQGPLQHVLGLIGKDMTAGKDKIFVWNVGKELGNVSLRTPRPCWPSRGMWQPTNSVYAKPKPR